MSPPYLQTLGNGIRVLEELGEGPKTLAELAAELGSQRVSTYRILRTLEAHRMVKKDPKTGDYRLTLRLWHLGVASLSESDLRAVALAHAEELRDRWGETVHVAVYEDGEAVYIHKLDGTMPLRSYTVLGGRAPSRCVATGKALLAFQPQPEIERQIRLGLTAFTDQTVTEPDILLSELEEIRDTGIALNRGEWRADIAGIASPILAPDGSVVAAIGISGPVYRLFDEQCPDRGEHVRRLAVTIAEAIAPDGKAAAVRRLYASVPASGRKASIISRAGLNLNVGDDRDTLVDATPLHKAAELTK